MIKLDKKLLWLQPYVKSIIKDIPYKKLKAIKGYTVIGKRVSQEGQIIKDSSGKLTITLKLNRMNIDEPDFYYNTLHTFAHEIAHIKVWNHSPEHFKLTGQFMKKFATVMKKKGIKNTYKRIP